MKQNRKKLMAPSHLKTIEALGVKLDMIHEDLIELKEVVEMLKEDYHNRKAVIKFLTTAMGALAVVVGWVVSKLNIH